MRVASRSCRMIAAFLAVVVAGVGLLAADVWAEEPLAEFEARVETALAAAESALASEEARLDDLAARNSRRTLADGRPSVAQAAANVRLWERRIRELGAGKRTLHGELDGVLGALGADIAALAQRLSAQGEKAARERAQREAEERIRREAEAARIAEREKAEKARAQREAEERTRRETEAARLAERQQAEKADREWAVGRVFRDCPHCPEMVVVPAGDFTMGSSASEEGRYDNEGPQHRVTIGYRFAVGVYEVTRGEFARFVRATSRAMGNSCFIPDAKRRERSGMMSGMNWRNPGFSQGDDHPAVCVSWNDAAAYARWLSQETGQAYRLLSESEWEYVARAGTTTARYWGESASALDQCRYANGADASSDLDYTAHCYDGYAWTAPVGSYGANGFGLHDVLGNVWEWVQDCRNAGYQGAPSNGSAWEQGDCSVRMGRGGSWKNVVPWEIRSARRGAISTGVRSSVQGFRVTRTLAP